MVSGHAVIDEGVTA